MAELGALHGCTRCYKTTAATGPATRFWSSGNLCSVHTERRGSATGIHVVSLLMLNHNPNSWFLMTIMVSVQSVIGSKLKRSNGSVCLKCSLTSTLVSNALLRWLETPALFLGS